MKTKILIFVIQALVGLNSAIIAQQKYALLIGGDMHATNVPDEHVWNSNIDPGPSGYDEFWNDTYLMWELLYDDIYGYSNENINVLYGVGVDYTFQQQDVRYNPYEKYGFNITDSEATKDSVMAKLDDLAGINEEDYLFVWIMSHGGNTIPTDNSDSYIYLWGYDPANPNAGRLYDYELKEKLDAIPNVKKVIMIQAPNSGGFATKLAGPNTIIFTSSHQEEPAKRADNKNQNSETVTENEVISGIVYNHGEFGFHIYSPLKGASPTGSTSYGTENFNVANNYEDDIISFGEAVNYWLLGHHSTTEEPIYSDSGNHGDISSVQFATLINKNIIANKNFTGIVGVTAIQEVYADVLITAGTTSFENARVYFLDNTRLVSSGGIIDVLENVVMTGNNPASYLYITTGISFTPGNLFTGHEGVRWGGIAATGISLFMNEVDFVDCHLFLDYIPSLDVRHGNFIRSGINGNHMTNVNISEDVYFTNSFCHLFGLKNSNVVIDEGHFSGPVINNSPNRGINIVSFNKYKIINSIIQNYNEGIQILHCHTLPSKDFIKNNSIHGNTSYGIKIINSSSEILDNVGIYENKTGIICNDFSNITIKGNSQAVHISETQKIFNNDLNQIYSTYNSFPILEWNAIWSDDNINCLVKIEPIGGTLLQKIL